jgi:CubicO group peptidase (beta-lactamase class C family)
MEDMHIMSLSAGIIIDDNLEWYKGYGSYRGYYNLLVPESKKIPNKDIIYMAGSISKSITATAIFQLHEKGLLNISDSVSKYLNFDFKNPFHPDTNITIKMLLNHSSSIKDSSFSFLSPAFSKIPMFKTLFLRILSGCFLGIYNERFWSNNTPPGSTFNYANVGYGVLQYLIEIVTHSSFEKYCHENIFEPLEMKNTSFHYKDFKYSQQAMPYFWINESQYYMRLRHYDIPLLAAGSLRTTVEDLSHFLIAHMNNGIYKDIILLNESSINAMHIASIKIYDPLLSIAFSEYGLGWIIVNASGLSGHGGDVLGSHAMMIMDKSNKTGLIYFWNSSDFSDHTPKEEIMLRINLRNALLNKLNELIGV